MVFAAILSSAAVPLGCRCRSSGSCRAVCIPPRPRSEIAADLRDSRSPGRPSSIRRARPWTRASSRPCTAAASARDGRHSKRSRPPQPARRNARQDRSATDVVLPRAPEVPDAARSWNSPIIATIVAELAQCRFIERRADQRVRIELPVTGMQHRPDRRAQRYRGIRLGDRVREGDQFEVERADGEPADIRTTLILTLSARPASTSLARSNDAVNGVAQTGQRGWTVGSALWSSCACVHQRFHEQPVTSFDNESQMGMTTSSPGCKSSQR